MYRGVIVFLFSAVLVADTLPAGQSASGDWTINCGLWRTDAGFTSIIQLKNRLVTGPIAVTPVLFMSDGTEYDLPTVNVPASGVATVNVNNALSSAAAANAGSLANHLSQYGSASLRFSGVAPTVIAQTALGSPVRSLSYVARFTGILEGQPVSDFGRTLVDPRRWNGWVCQLEQRERRGEERERSSDYGQRTSAACSIVHFSASCRTDA